MPAVLITGANRGLGLEFARQYTVDKWQTLATARQPEAASELLRLAANHSNISIHELDIANMNSI